MNKHVIVDTIQQQIPAVNKEEATIIAKAIREPMWQWHEVMANVMLFLFLARIIYMLASGIRFPNPFKKSISIKERLQGLVYIYFYVFVFISIVTGICIEKGFFEQYEKSIEAVHKWGLYWFPIFVFLHIIGIIIAELTDKKGITSKMIGGDKS